MILRDVYMYRFHTNEKHTKGIKAVDLTCVSYYMFKLLQDAISFLIAKTRIVEYRSIDVDRT